MKVGHFLRISVFFIANKKTDTSKKQAQVKKRIVVKCDLFSFL